MPALGCEQSRGIARAAFLCSLRCAARGSAAVGGPAPVEGLAVPSVACLADSRVHKHQQSNLSGSYCCCLFEESNDQAKLSFLHVYFLFGLCQSVGPGNLLIML